MSIPVKEAADGLPELGTAQAAVESCVTLIAGAVGKPAAAIHYWLDLYYFVRAAYERENAPDPEEAPVFIRAEDLIPALRQLWQEVIGKQDGEDKRSAVAAQAKAREGNGAEQSAPPPRKKETVTNGEPAAPKKSGAPKGNTSSADAAAFKREVAQRLREARQHGLTMGKILELSRRKVTEHTIMDILDGKKVPIGIYRELDDVLNYIDSDS